MKVVWNKKTNLPVIEFEDSDFTNSVHVKQMMEGKFKCDKCGCENENFAWRILEGYFATMRLSVEERGKFHARGRATKDLCSNDFSILDGFDVAVGIPQKIVLQADMMRMQNNKIKEAQNAGREDDSE